MLFFGPIRHFRIYWKSLNTSKRTTQPRPKSLSKKLKPKCPDLANFPTPVASSRSILPRVCGK